MIKGIAIDLQFTLVYLDNFSLDGWFVLLNKGFSKVIEYLKESGYKIHDLTKLKRTLRRVRNKYFAKYVTGEDQQYFTEEILGDTFHKNDIQLASEREFIKCCQLYHQFEIPAWIPFPNMQKSLETLSKEYILGLITNSSEYVTSQNLKLYKIDPYFRYVYNKARKPRLTAFEKFQAELNIPFDQLVMIGDDLTTDIIPAQQLGMKTIHSFRGYEYVKDHAQLDIVPDRQITQFQKVVEAVKSL